MVNKQVFLGKYSKSTLLRMKPYDFMKNIVLDIFKDEDAATEEEHLMAKFIHTELKSKDMRVIEVDDRLLPLIKSTDNKIFFRPLFFPSMFINTDVDLGENNEFILKGIIVTDMRFFISKNIIEKNNEHENSNWLFLGVIISKKLDDDKVGLVIGTLFDPVEDLNCSAEKIRVFIRNFLCNIMDIVNGNQEDLDIRTITPKIKQQIKRENKKKSLAPTKVFIRPKIHFINYLESFNKNHNSSVSHKFLVRGHWRHFRHKRYSEFKRQNPIWIKPYFKGDGIIINKTYILKDEN